MNLALPYLIIPPGHKWRADRLMKVGKDCFCEPVEMILSTMKATHSLHGWDDLRRMRCDCLPVLDTKEEVGALECLDYACPQIQMGNINTGPA